MLKGHQVRGRAMKMQMKVVSIEYTSISEKQAYLNGCKDLASLLTNENITINVEKVKAESPTVVFHIYTNVDINSAQKDFCKACKEFHCNFYINEDYNCKRCNMKAFLQRLKERANVSKGYVKSQLKTE